MGAYVATTVFSPAPPSVLYPSGGVAYTLPARANDGDDATAATYNTPLVIGAGAINLNGFVIASVELQNFSASLGTALQNVVIRGRHVFSMTFAGDTNPAHFVNQRQPRSHLEYSTDSGTSWNALATHTAVAGGDLVLADHVDVLGFALTGVDPSRVRMRETFLLFQFRTNSSFTGGTFTIDSQMKGMEIIADTKMIGAMFGFM